MAMLTNIVNKINKSPIAGKNRDEIILELYESHIEMESILMDILKTVADSHPEIILKYVGFIDRNKK